MRRVAFNEQRQNYENAPYGMASIEIARLLYPEGHPYRWPTIGCMEDLSAASYQDVVEFFKKYYQPANASLVIAGDIDTAKARAAVEKWFADAAVRLRAPAGLLFDAWRARSRRECRRCERKAIEAGISALHLGPLAGVEAAGVLK